MKMGQYHAVYNLDKKQKFEEVGHSMAKLLEQVGDVYSNATALYLLVANSNGRGGGDANSHHLIGSWAGDRVVVQGDYAKDGDQGFIDDESKTGFIDITPEVSEMLRVALADY
jgi:hypothetical protein